MNRNRKKHSRLLIFTLQIPFLATDSYDVYIEESEVQAPPRESGCRALLQEKEEDYVDVKKDWQPLHSGIVLFFTFHISHDSTALPFCKFRIRSGKNRLRTRQYIFSFAAFY